jgi:hypothetical protein
MKIRSRKAQAWGFDLIAGLMIFVLGVVLFYFYAVNNSSGNEQKSLFMKEEAKLVAEILLTGGSPVNWNVTNVERIGFYDNGKINQTKLNNFYNLTNADYSRARALFNINDDFYVFFSSNVSVGGQVVSFIGDNQTQNAKNVVKVTRAVVYDNRVVGMEVNVWN